MYNSCSVCQCYVSMSHEQCGVSTVWGTAQHPCSDSPHLMGTHNRKARDILVIYSFGDKRSLW